MSVHDEGSVARLLRLCGGYFFFYVLTGVSVKYCQGPTSKGLLGIEPMAFLAWSTLGGNLLCMSIVAARGWYRLPSDAAARRGLLGLPPELFWVIPSGICTAVIVPATTLMYSLPISVMVAMVMMRGCVIVISRLVDAIQRQQGLPVRPSRRLEDAAVVFAIAAVATEPLFGSGDDGFAFLHSPTAVAILTSYVVAYALRIYLMNWYKNTRPQGTRLAGEMWFGVEQIVATLTLGATVCSLFLLPLLGSWDPPQTQGIRAAFTSPPEHTVSALIAGTAFGAVAFFSVFLFLFPGRTATFAGLVNRLTSLVAGTTATLLSALMFGGRWPSVTDWGSLGLISVAVGLLAMAERKPAP